MRGGAELVIVIIIIIIIITIVVVVVAVVVVVVVVIDQTPKKDVLVVQGDWNAKVGKDACGNWQDPSAMTTQMRDDSDLWSLPPLTILCWRTLLVITKNPEDRPGMA